MKSYIASVLYCIFFSVLLISCSQSSKGISEAVGGSLPTHYIIIKDGSFDPVSITAVRNSTFTFVNHSGSAKGIYSSDSVTINKQNIPDNSSYIFSKDTLGTIIYRMAGRPSVTGSVTITP